MAETFTEQDVMEELKDAIEEAGSQRALALKLGVSVNFVNRMLHGHRPIGGKVLAHLGFERRSFIVARPTSSKSPTHV